MRIYEQSWLANVGKQLNLNQEGNGGNETAANGATSLAMSDDEYYRRYGRNKVVNYLKALSNVE